MSELTQNGVTRAADSSLGTRPTPVDGKMPPDLKAQYDYHKQLARDFAKKIKAEQIKSAAKKTAERKAREEAELEALKCAIYKIGYRCQKADQMLLWVDILTEFQKDMLDQHYTLAAMKARADAKALAEAEAAGVRDLEEENLDD